MTACSIKVPFASGVWITVLMDVHCAVYFHMPMGATCALEIARDHRCVWSGNFQEESVLTQWIVEWTWRPVSCAPPSFSCVYIRISLPAAAFQCSRPHTGQNPDGPLTPGMSALAFAE